MLDVPDDVLLQRACGESIMEGHSCMILLMNWFNLDCFITTVGDDETQASDAKAVMEALALGPVNASLFSTSAGDCGQVGGPMCGAGGGPMCGGSEGMMMRSEGLRAIMHPSSHCARVSCAPHAQSLI